MSRIERGLALDVSIQRLADLLATVGLELSVRTYPGGSPLRDRAHLALLGRLRSGHPAEAAWRSEVPLPDPRDQRTWDAVVSYRGIRVGIEAETRPRDIQDLQRRLALKKRDGRVDRVVLLMADTRHNRALMRDHAEQLAGSFPIPGREALARLRAGHDPGGDTVILM